MKYQGFLLRLCALGGCMLLSWTSVSQNMYKFETDSITVVFFDKALGTHLPHIVRMHSIGTNLHRQLWTSPSDSPLYRPDHALVYLTDWQDDGNGGVNAFPVTNIQIGTSPLNMSFFVSPSVERYYHLFCHEQTHVVMTDKASTGDMRWRKLFGQKVPVDKNSPLSALWSYASAPRWYAPRWFHEGIACFSETWMCGGVGRALAGYDDMYFRSLVLEGDHMSSVVGLESEGTASDFQLGTNAYLYGTRFVNYLALRHGIDSLCLFYNRTDSSHAFFARQFQQVYGTSVRQEWDNWQQYEVRHQQQNTAAISQYPTTPTSPLTDQPLGSVGPLAFDPARKCIYAAINHPGDFARIVRIDTTGHIHRIAYIDDPRLYTPSYITLDTVNDRLIYTTQNQKYRGLRAIDLKSGKNVFSSNFQRLSNIVYDNRGNRMYALYTAKGSISLVRIDSTLTRREILYAFPFGMEVFDIDVSHDGSMISATLSGKNGEHSLVVFRVADLENSNFTYRTLATLENCNFNGFRFSLDDKTLLGSSYYTGVANLWAVDVQTGKMELLSNTLTGLFNPLEIAPDTLLALEFKRDGLQPVMLQKHVVKDANAIDLLGQKTYDRNAEALSAQNVHLSPKREIRFDSVFNHIEPYKPVREMRFSGSYPDLSGFVDRQAWNNVTPVLGYNFKFQDPMMISSLSVKVGISPWSHNDWENKFHLNAQWDLKFWHFSACWNNTDFYDLFGPVRTSHKGYALQAGYTYTSKMLPPLENRWGVSLSAYGMMDVIPLTQDIMVSDSIKSMQGLTAFASIRKTRRSLGGVKDEQGWELGTYNYMFLAGGKRYPTVTLTANGGVLLPVLRNTALWLRNTIGHNIANDGSVFSYTYFGGFQYNWVDCSMPYRTADLYNWNAMPGARIDQLSAHTFLRSALQLDLQPIRFKNFGALSIYPTWLQFSPFGGMLLTGGNGNGTQYFNYGIKVSIEVVLFNNLRTNWNLGYGRIHGYGSNPMLSTGNEFMFSLKLF